MLVLFSNIFYLTRVIETYLSSYWLVEQNFQCIRSAKDKLARTTAVDY